MWKKWNVFHLLMGVGYLTKPSINSMDLTEDVIIFAMFYGLRDLLLSEKNARRREVETER